MVEFKQRKADGHPSQIMVLSDELQVGYIAEGRGGWFHYYRGKENAVEPVYSERDLKRLKATVERNP